MKFFCDKSLLNEAVSNVSLAVSNKTNLSILEGIYMECNNSSLKLTCYNLEFGISTEIKVNVTEKGRSVINTSLLLSIISKMPEGDIYIHVNEENTVFITCNDVEFNIPSSDPDNFPELPKIENNESIELPQHILRNMLDQTLFAAAQSDQNPINTGCLFNIGDHMLTLVTVDGYRLALRKEPVAVEENIKVIVPAKTLTEISKLINKLSKDDEEQKTLITVSSNHIQFNICGYSVISRIMEGEFIDYNKVIPSGNSTAVKIKRKDLQDSINRTTIIISEKTKSAVKCLVKKDVMNISCETALGKINENIFVDFSGMEIKIGFNNRYMLDVLKSCDCEYVKLEMNGPLSPIKIVPESDESFLYLILPIRLKDDE